jgi:hypothetical protein
VINLQEDYKTTRCRDGSTHDEKCVGLGCLETNGEIQTSEDRVYLQLISEKIKSAADWDFRDARTFHLG